MIQQSNDKNSLLSTIHSPDDLQRMKPEEMAPLAEEVRSYLVRRVHENGGHLASNLGIVEASLAIHRVFSSPKDHIIFDVGHQSYVHKLITGRGDRFDTLRKGGGISGFPKRSESVHDAFGTGHSSTSLSAALGFAEADKLSGSDAYTICILGDGAYTGGMVHEALNNSKKDLRLIIVLNENEMSISKNIGRFAKSLSRLRTSKGYFRTKSATATILQKIPLVGKKIFSLLLRLKVAIKSALYGSNYFENLGLYYLGPIDGNDEQAVENLLREAKKTNQSCIVHLKTTKGKGYAPAEENPGFYHGMAPANAPHHDGKNFSEQMGDILCELAQKDETICAITAAMASGTGLLKFKESYPTRFFDVGIAEAHATTFAAGLAANGYRPVFAVYSSFLQRAYDSVIHDVALQDLPVVFCVDRAGLNASDGATHHGIFDVAFLSQIPNLHIYTPITGIALRNAMKEALQVPHPCAIRYPNGFDHADILQAFYQDPREAYVGVRCDSNFHVGCLDAVIITHGRIVLEALKAQKALASLGKHVGILLLEKLKPYDVTAKEVEKYLPKDPCKLLFLEEEIRMGGMGMLLSDALKESVIAKNKTINILGMEDSFGIQTKDEPIFHSMGLDADAIMDILLS